MNVTFDTRTRVGLVYKKPALIIGTLETLAILVSFMPLYGDVPNATTTKVMVVPAWTGNWGNGATLQKVMTTKFTLSPPAPSAVLMELSSYVKMGLRTVAERAPREGNMEADVVLMHPSQPKRTPAEVSCGNIVVEIVFWGLVERTRWAESTAPPWAVAKVCPKCKVSHVHSDEENKQCLGLGKTKHVAHISFFRSTIRMLQAL